MKKRIISMVLSCIMVLGTCKPLYAWTPTDFNDPKCIDLSNLRTQGKGFLLRVSKGKNVCGCKTCMIDAVTYTLLEDYISDLQKQLSVINQVIPVNKQRAINWETGKYGALNLILLTDSIAALLHPIIRGETANPIVKATYWAIMAGGVLVGFICQYKQNHYEALILENEARINNIETILESITKAIDRKDYKNANFLLVSANNDLNNPSATAFFSEKENISYSNSTYTSDEYFNKINEKKIKPLLIRIKDGEFHTYKKHKYETIYRDYLKKGLCVTIPFDVFAETFNAFRVYNPETLQKIKSYLTKIKLSPKKIKILLKEIEKLARKETLSTSDFIGLGVESVTVIMDDELVAETTQTEL